jgi:hypothetical protein
MKIVSKLSWVLAAAGIVSCGGGSTTSPTPRSGPQSFLTGTWSGTLTIEREGEATTTGPVTWTFAVVPDTNLQTFQTTIRSQHTWLPITATVSSAITPSSTPPARISTQGSYTSPRGCTGTLLSVGKAEAARIEADFSGLDCPSLERSTFTGHVSLTKTGSP